MLMKSLFMPAMISLATLAIITFDASCQTGIQPYEDYKISGSIIDALTKEPVNATLVFECVPDASDVYIIHSKRDTGSYEVTIRRKSKYVVEVTSENYKPEIDTVNIYGNLSDLNYELLYVKPGQLLRLHNIYFDQGDYEILNESIQEISEIILLLNQYPNMTIRLEGHTDRLGGRSANMVLSEQRVGEIKKYMVTNGIDPKRIKIAAFGGTKPISTENTEESRRLNRRVEVRILSI